ncbi:MULTISPECIES: hypothetical protein [Actinomadura]|uniref:Uncharacterized protein n=1 Tax=Actinomadura yumaensis TaxID=111807 RepID=A0ABW2CJA1_9ACTN|nr:hypothetical protein [Actinomadura sp. J1-007]
MLVPDRAELGRWLLDAKPLLRQGLAWYLPTYTCRGRWYDHRLATELDYLVKDRRVIDLTGADPLKLELMRNVLTVEVPHVAGTDLNTFAKIVTGEFDAFRDFREYLREELLELHLAADAVDSARQIELVATRIRRQVGEWTARMKDARRGRAWGTTGAGLGTTAAALSLVSGADLPVLLAGMGFATPFLVQGMLAQRQMRHLKDEGWFLVWSFQRQTRTL